MAQIENPAGDYYLKLGKDGETVLEYKLALSNDGRFEFDYYRFIKTSIPQEEHYYGKGTWSVKENIVYFTTNPATDSDEHYTLDFSESKARFVFKNPRDTSERKVPTKLQFLESKIPWMERVAILKL